VGVSFFSFRYHFALTTAARWLDRMSLLQRTIISVLASSAAGQLTTNELLKYEKSPVSVREEHGKS
jgi:hypothetical protein